MNGRNGKGGKKRLLIFNEFILFFVFFFIFTFYIPRTIHVATSFGSICSRIMVITSYSRNHAFMSRDYFIYRLHVPIHSSSCLVYYNISPAKTKKNCVGFEDGNGILDVCVCVCVRERERDNMDVWSIFGFIWLECIFCSDYVCFYLCGNYVLVLTKETTTSFSIYWFNIYSFYAMYKACRKNNKPFVSTMLIQNFPITVYCAAFFFWVTSPYSFILSHHHYILYCLTAGIVFGRMATKIILAHLLKTRFPRFTVLLIPLIAGAIISNLPRVFDM